MSFTPFGRGAERNGSSSHFNDAHSSNAGDNGKGEDHAAINGNGNGTESRLPCFRATLSSGVSIKGTVTFRRELVIDGDVEGTIHSVGRLTVGRNGHVRGDIQTRSVTVHGTVDGNLSVGEKCELRSGCTLRGDIETSRLIVDEDVNFIGNAEIATRDYLSELRPLNGNGQK
jgi:cytoskeletal protein CcmA (bactofilin family)